MVEFKAKKALLKTFHFYFKGGNIFYICNSYSVYLYLPK